MSTRPDAVAESASITAPVFSWRWLLPRWWLTWLGLGLMRLLSLLPINAQLALGEFVGRALGHVAGSRREVVRTNLRLCFPDMSLEERERWVNAHFASLGRGLFETTMAWFATDAELAPRVDIEGREHLDAALASGQGLLLLTGHFSSLEIGARVLRVKAKLPFHAMYRPYANPVMDYYMHRWRGAQAGLPALPRDDLRRLVRALRDGRAIWYAPDQTLGRSMAVFAPFFGVPALTVSATSRLAKMGRARVLPYMPRYTGKGWCVRFFPMLEDFPGEDETADTTRINQALEAGVLLAMDQYFWIHKRFKRRPPGMDKVY